MTRHTTIAKLFALSIAAGSAFAAHAQAQRECDVCPLEPAVSDPAPATVVSTGQIRECDLCPTPDELTGTRIRLTKAD